VQRGIRGSGIPVNPERLKEARLAAGLTMAQVAGTQVSRTFIHQLEAGLSRPSAPVLEMIAKRTRKPVRYFTTASVGDRLSKQQLALDLVRIAARVKRFRESADLGTAQKESLKLLESALRQGAVITRNL
jgi:transcriptional regulator with XRE-family HTH domain